MGTLNGSLRPAPRGTASPTILRLVLLVALGLTAACSDDGRQSSGDSAAPPVDAARHAPAGAARAVSAVQVGAFSDSATAMRLRDSLATAGWRAVAARGESDGEAIWRVRIGASQTSALPELITHALTARGREALVVRDSAAPSELTGRLIPLNTGTHGMAARVLWAHSPDRRAMLAVEDPTAVEAEPIPNGFVFATEEGGFALQRDSVWHVSPSADWTKLAYGRSAGAFAREQSGLTDAQWQEMARKIGLPVEVVRRESFSISGMNYASGIARAAVIDLASAPRGEMPEARDLPHALGWRVRWLRSGDALALGTAPRSVQDYSPASSWVVVDPATGAIRDTLPPSPAGRDGGPEPPDDRFAAIDWTEGPTLDISVAIDTASERVIEVEGGRVVSRNGWIRIERSGSGTRIVGPGTVLAASRTGEYIAALAPAPDAEEFEAKTRAVVYSVAP